MDFKKLMPHFIAIVVLLAVAALFFAPNAFSGKVLPQPDNDKARGMQTEIMQYLDKDGKTPLWTNAAFSGMPSYQIYLKTASNLTVPVMKTMHFWQNINDVWAQVFVAMLCMYLLLAVLKVDWRIGIFGAIAFGITSYNVDILEAGHSTKMTALALTPGLFAGAVLVFNGRWLLGAGLLALFSAMQVNANHIQITYYGMIVLGFYFVAQLIASIQNKRAFSWVTAAAITGLTLLLGLASNTARIWPTYEYGKETIRGVSDLSQKSSKGDGLDKNYLFGWSYGISETLTLIVPHAYGGGAGENIQNTEFFKLINRGGSPAQRDQLGRQTASVYYCGAQPFVGTAIYFGAIVCFLFLLGAFLVKGVEKWWLLLASLFCISLAWGSNFFLNDIWYDYMPMFKKFRAVSMALGVAQLCFAVLAALGLQKLFDADIAKETKMKALYAALGTAALFCLSVFVFGGSVGPNDEQVAGQIKMPIAEFSKLLAADRAAMQQSDIFRSLGFILAAAALLWFYLQGKMKSSIAVLSVAALSLVDTWSVCTRTLTSDKYENRKEATAPPKQQAFNAEISADKDPHFRVLDFANGGMAGNWTTSYFHKSMSGYHAAKLQRYQEVIDTLLNPAQINNHLHIVGMLNGKYIVSQKGDVIKNPKVLGNAWFVKNIQTVATSEAELKGLSTLNPRDTALILAANAAELKGFQANADTTASIKLTAYHPDKMDYEYSSNSDQFAVFSEVYYPPSMGWHCYLNGTRMDDFVKVNYLLRGLKLPAGKAQKLEMRFEPKSYILGEKIAYAASALALLLFFGGLFFWFKNHSLPGASYLSEMEGNKASNEENQRERLPKTAIVEKKGKKK
jgi:hypothetical protein